MATQLTKEKILVEDMELGFGAAQQARGGNKFNAAYLPYTVSKSVEQALTERPTSAEVDSGYAKLHGSSAERFSVADATGTTDAVNKQQVETAIAVVETAKSDKTEVIRKGAGEAYNPSADTDPINKGYADGLIADKFLGAITGKFIAKSIADGTTNVTVTVTNGVITEIL